MDGPPLQAQARPHLGLRLLAPEAPRSAVLSPSVATVTQHLEGML